MIDPIPDIPADSDCACPTVPIPYKTGTRTPVSEICLVFRHCAVDILDILDILSQYHSTTVPQMSVEELAQGGASRIPTSATDECTETVPCNDRMDRLLGDLPVGQYIAECLENSEAPIKRDYARLVSSRVPYRPHAASEAAAVDGASGASGASGAGSLNGPENARTSSKGRVDKNRRQALRECEKRLCTKVARGLVCQYGDACKFTHDMDAYLREKAEDLVGPCPWSAVDGGEAAVCPFGLGCRFYGAHDGKMTGSLEGPLEGSQGTRAAGDSRFWMDDGTIPSGGMLVVDVGRRVLRTMNDLERDVRMALRKKAYDFGKVEEALRELGITDSRKAANKGRKGEKGGCKRKAVGISSDEAGDGAAKGEVVRCGGAPAQGMELEPRAREGCVETGSGRRARDYAKKVFDARGKTYLAPLTTVGNLPFRRLCKRFGADITCGEMAMGQNLVQGHPSEWALLKRHPDEDFFGVQVCGSHAGMMAYCAQLIEENCEVDFVDINCGCPIDVVVNKGAGSALLTKPKKLEEIVRTMTSIMTCPVTIKMRRGFDDRHDLAHKLIPRVGAWGASAVVLHGRTRKQRYSRPADWDYIRMAASLSKDSCQVIGNGDVHGWQDHVKALESGEVVTTYVARGALIKPWIFTEIKERRDWDISAAERLDIVRQYVRNGLEVRWLFRKWPLCSPLSPLSQTRRLLARTIACQHWGSDSQGVENTRRFLLEWLSFAHRYIPAGLLEVLPQRSNWRPSAFVGRSDLETLLASPDPADWIRISTWFLGPTPNGYKFHAKHQAKSHGAPAAGARDG